MELLIKKLDDRAKVPEMATGGSAGMDLCALLDAPLVLEPGQRAMVPTGIAIALESPEYVALIFARSGLAVKHGITLSNCVGVVDSDYRGEGKVGLINLSDAAYEIAPGERIAQMVIMPVVASRPKIVDTLPETARGEGGFGSTGRK